MNPKLKVWAPVLLIVAIVAGFFAFKVSTTDPAIPTAPAQAGPNPQYYTPEELAAAQARGETLPGAPETPSQP